MRFRFRFASPCDLDECQRRIWLLNGTMVAIRDSGAMTCIARAHADEAGFAVWTINLIYAGRVTESALAARGRWWTDGAVTRVEVGFRPRPMFAVLLYTVLGALGLFGFALVLRPPAYQDSLAELVVLVMGGGVFAIAVLTVVAAQELRSLAWDRFIEAALCDPVEPGGEGPVRGRGTSRRARRRRPPVRSGA